MAGVKYLGDGKLFGLAVIPEDDGYGVMPASPDIDWQHIKGSSVGPRCQPRTAKRLTVSPPTTRDYPIGHSDGEFQVLHSLSDAVIGKLLALGSQRAGTGPYTYTFGLGLAPTEASATIYQVYDDFMLRFLGFKPNLFRWEFSEEEVVLSVGGLAKKGTSATYVSPSMPADSTVFMPGSIGSITLGAASIVINKLTLEVQLPLTDPGRVGLGGVHREPWHIGQQPVTARLDCELSDETGNDTIAQWDDWESGVSLGDRGIGSDFTFGSAYAVGDAQALEEGVTKCPLNLVGSNRIVGTS